MDDSQAQRRTLAARIGTGLITGLGLAAVAAIFAFLLLYEDRPAEGIEPGQGIWIFVGETLLGHAAGGFVVGVLLSIGFGRTGLGGWILAFLLGVVASLLSGALGGAASALAGALTGPATFATAEVISAAAGALVVPMAIAGSPFLIVLWLVLIGGVHAITGAARHG